MSYVSDLSQTYYITARLATYKLRLANYEVQQLRGQMRQLMSYYDFAVLLDMNYRAIQLRSEVARQYQDLEVYHQYMQYHLEEMADLRTQLSECYGVCKQLQAENALLRNEKTEPRQLEAQLAEAYKEIQVVKRELTDFKSAAASLKIENAQLKRRVFELTYDVFAQYAIYTAKDGASSIEYLMMYKIELGYEKFRCEGENAMLQQKLIDSTEYLTYREAAFTRMQEEVSNARQKASEDYSTILALNGDNARLLGERDTLQHQVYLLEEQLEDKQKALTKLQEQFAQAMNSAHV